jgi:hypothetical protein
MDSGSIVCHLQINREALELTSLRGVGRVFYDGVAETEKIKGLHLEGKNCRSANSARTKALRSIQRATVILRSETHSSPVSSHSVDFPNS